jgi:AraC-like DNA-binding protein
MLASVSGEEQIIGAGEGCFVDRFCIHSFSELENDTEIYIFVGSGEIFAPIIEELGGIPGTKFAFSDFDLLDRVTEYYERAKNESIKTPIFKGAVTLLLAAVAEKNTLLPMSKRDSSTDICDILLYINEHFTEDLTLDSLAARFGYSPQYFSRLFHRYMRINLTEYINVARVNYAKKQLSLGKSVAEIAFESGFGSMPSFYRAYKKVFGDLPRG